LAKGRIADLPNVNRFSEFFHCETKQQISNEIDNKDAARRVAINSREISGLTHSRLANDSVFAHHVYGV